MDLFVASIPRETPELNTLFYTDGLLARPAHVLGCRDDMDTINVAHVLSCKH